METLRILLTRIKPDAALLQWFQQGGYERLIPYVIADLVSIPASPPVDVKKEDYPEVNSSNPVDILRTFVEQVDYLKQHSDPKKVTALVDWAQKGLAGYKPYLQDLTGPELLDKTTFFTKYAITQCLGRGQEGIAFQVKPEGVEKTYVLKIQPYTDWQTKREYFIHKALNRHNLPQTVKLYNTVWLDNADVVALMTKYPKCEKPSYREKALYLGWVIDEVPLPVVYPVTKEHVFSIIFSVYKLISLGIWPKDLGVHNMGFFESEEPLVYTLPSGKSLTLPPGIYSKWYDYGWWSERDLPPLKDVTMDDIRDMLVDRSPVSYMDEEALALWTDLLTSEATPEVALGAAMDTLVQTKA